VLLKVNGRSILGHITHYWSDIANGFVIIVSKENEQLIRQQSGNAEFVVQKEPKGIADAILRAEPYVDDYFMVVLGDCLYKGRFNIMLPFKGQGIGIWRTKDLDAIRQSYSVEMNGEYLSRVVEKPSNVLNNWCGMGVYFLDRCVFDYIRKTPPSLLRGEVEITDVLQKMIEAEERIRPLFFEGKYINITHPNDIRKAEEVLQ